MLRCLSDTKVTAAVLRVHSAYTTAVALIHTLVRHTSLETVWLFVPLSVAYTSHYLAPGFQGVGM